MVEFLGCMHLKKKWVLVFLAKLSNGRISVRAAFVEVNYCSGLKGGEWNKEVLGGPGPKRRTETH